MTGLVRGAVVIAMGAMSVLSIPAHTAAGADPAMSANTIAVEFMWAIEVERTSRGLPAVFPDAALCASAQEWSGGMALFDTLVHDRAYTVTVAASDPAWEAAAENVGEGPTPQSIEAAFMASAPHRANILGDYTHVGVGAFVDGAGRIWVTERFYR